MAYKLFISFTGRDKLIAEEIHNQLINSFKDKIEVFISSQSLSPGERWIDRIKNTLSEYDGIICLITPNSIDKQWIFVEWSAFWLNEKDIFVCLSDSSLAVKLIQPIKETQYMLVNLKPDVEKFFKVLSEKSKTKPIPYNFVSEYINSINKAIEKQQENLFDEYLSNLNNLPAKDEIKIDIAKYCLDNGKYKELSSVLDKTRSDYLKTNLANELIDLGQLTKIEYIYEFIRASQNQTEIVISLIDNRYEDLNIYKKLIDSIYSKDQTQLFNISKYLIEKNKEKENLFKYIIEKIDNMAELRKVAWCLIDHSKHKDDLFKNILLKFEERNRTELRKVGEYLINNSNDYEEELSLILEILERKSKEQHKMLKELIETKK